MFENIEKAGKRDEEAWDTAEKITREFEAELIAEQIAKGEIELACVSEKAGARILRGA